MRRSIDMIADLKHGREGGRFAHIFWVHCTAHALDLTLEDIGKLPLFKQLTSSMGSIIKFIKNHQQSHSMFLAKSPLRLLSPGELPCYWCIEVHAAVAYAYCMVGV